MYRFSKFSGIISYIRYDIPQGIKSLFIWFKVIWNDRSWDWVFIFYILRKKLELMEHTFRVHGHAVDSEKTAHEIKICKLLLDRLIKADYIMTPEKRKIFPIKGSKMIDYEDMMMNQDLSLLTKIINRKVFTWWD